MIRLRGKDEERLIWLRRFGAAATPHFYDVAFAGSGALTGDYRLARQSGTRQFVVAARARLVAGIRDQQPPTFLRRRSCFVAYRQRRILAPDWGKLLVIWV